MSAPTQPAFILFTKGWSPELLQHPSSPFMHEHEKLLDSKRFEEMRAYYADDFVYTKSSGESFTGISGVDQMIADYSLFAEHFHEPIYAVISETEKGYRLIGHAKLYINLPGAVDKPLTDLSGKKWELAGEGAFIFELVRDPSGPLGFKYTRTQIFVDPTPILKVALKRGLIPVEALSG